jgi:hypothetical protein
MTEQTEITPAPSPSETHISCCSAGAQTSCCVPSEKVSCCGGGPDSGRCGCR